MSSSKPSSSQKSPKSTTTTAHPPPFQTPPKTSASRLVSSDMTTLCEGSNRLYLKSLDVMLDTLNNTTWTIRVGDLACLQVVDTCVESTTTTDNNSTDTQQQYDPFTTAYRPVQILAIYQEIQHVVVNKLSSSKRKRKRYDSNVCVEVRYFYRGGDLDEVTRQRYCESGEEEVFETDRVEVAHASFLLGRLVLNSNRWNGNSDDTTVNDDTKGKTTVGKVPSVTMKYNHRFYFHQQQEVLQLNVLEEEDSGMALLRRGIKASRVLAENEEVRMATCGYLNLSLDNDNDDDAVMMQSRKSRDDGGTMAMDDDDDVSTSDAAAMDDFREGKSRSEQNTLIDKSPALATAAASSSSTTTAAQIANQMERSSKRVETPITEHDEHAAADNHVSVSTSIPEPSTVQRRSKRSKTPVAKAVTAMQASDIASSLPEPSATSSLRRSKRAKTPIVKGVAEVEPKKRARLDSPKRKLFSSQIEDAQEDDVVKLRVKCVKQPFHVDVSSQKSFYDEIDILPPLDSYDDRFSMNRSATSSPWTVRLGDTVCIEVEERQRMDISTFPFVVTWSPAEIVSIYRVHDNKTECLELREKLQKGGHPKLNGDDDNSFFEDVMVEVRWFYRKHEIPGASSKSVKSQSNHDGELEEIFETDQIDSCQAECLLSPLKLFEVSRPAESLPNVVSGMPCIYYHCRRYWSIHRKSFIPSGVLSNRIERGRMHSKYKAALSKLPSTAAKSGGTMSETYSWKEGFQSAIQKLSLAEAAADVQVKGMELKCRERERRHIGSFLRKAICGLEQHSNTRDDDSVMSYEGPMNTKSSIFICGPPGTGKTASVRSIINELQEEQASGNLPEFNFIALNGMEMRSPFDSYVKFWEALSGTMKERLSAGAAAAKLEEYFGDGDRDGSNQDRSLKRPITVLMLDEIDYLVTKKQTILYNFFDWPLRATHARLIVIGISNTINLPERLSPKLQSRLGGERCHFKSYTVDETVAILKTRLDGDASQVFDEDAIKFASRKTGNLSGDIRKAFQMCKVAAQNALDDYTSGGRRIVEGSHPKVKIADVQRGSRDMYTSIIHKAISCSSSYEALVLIAIGALKKTKVGTDIISLDVREMLMKIESIANGSGEERYLSARLSLGDLLGILRRLGDAGILTLTTPKQFSQPWPLFQTSLEPYEINSSYRNTSHSKLAEKHLAEQRLF